MTWQQLRYPVYLQESRGGGHPLLLRGQLRAAQLLRHPQVLAQTHQQAAWAYSTWRKEKDGHTEVPPTGSIADLDPHPAGSGPGSESEPNPYRINLCPNL